MQSRVPDVPVRQTTWGLCQLQTQSSRSEWASVLHFQQGRSRAVAPWTHLGREPTEPSVPGTNLTG